MFRKVLREEALGRQRHFGRALSIFVVSNRALDVHASRPIGAMLELSATLYQLMTRYRMKR